MFVRPVKKCPDEVTRPPGKVRDQWNLIGQGLP